MDDTARVIAIAAVVVIFTIAVWLSRRSRHPRAIAESIVSLLGALARDPANASYRADLHRELSGSPLPPLPELTADGGWFDRSAPSLEVLAAHDDTRVYIEWFFHRFHFIPGQKQKPLLWLHRLLQIEIRGRRNLQTFANVAERLLATATPTEATWLYGCLLDAVQQTNGDPNVKAATVRVGRVAYAAGRYDRRPTIYDEQAIANDVAARVA